jgi:hypothetical protein
LLPLRALRRPTARLLARRTLAGSGRVRLSLLVLILVLILILVGRLVLRLGRGGTRLRLRLLLERILRFLLVLPLLVGPGLGSGLVLTGRRLGLVVRRLVGLGLVPGGLGVLARGIGLVVILGLLARLGARRSLSLPLGRVLVLILLRLGWALVLLTLGRTLVLILLSLGGILVLILILLRLGGILVLRPVRAARLPHVGARLWARLVGLASRVCVLLRSVILRLPGLIARRVWRQRVRRRLVLVRRLVLTTFRRPRRGRLRLTALRAGLLALCVRGLLPASVGPSLIVGSLVRLLAIRGLRGIRVPGLGVGSLVRLLAVRGLRGIRVPGLIGVRVL